MDDQGWHRRRRAGTGAHDGPVRAIQFARRSGLPRQSALGDALRIRRAPGKSREKIGRKTMTVPHSDALVFYGATGDLAFKKIFPALQAMVKRAHLKVPVIGVAKADCDLDQLTARARE